MQALVINASGTLFSPNSLGAEAKSRFDGDTVPEKHVIFDHNTLPCQVKGLFCTKKPASLDVVPDSWTKNWGSSVWDINGREQLKLES